MKKYWQKKKILITGANGFIGSSVCQELLNIGAKVTALVSPNSSLNNLKGLNNKIKLLRKDLINDVFEIQEKIVFHLAALDGGQKFKKQHGPQILQQNLIMTSKMIELSQKANVEKFIFFSSAEVYQGKKRAQKRKIKETDFNIDEALLANNNLYMWSKIIGESICLQSKLKTIIIRPANIYGERDSVQKERLIPLLLDNIKNNNKEVVLTGDGSPTRSFMYIEDFVKNLLALTGKLKKGIYNIAGENPISLKKFVNLFHNICGINIKFISKTKQNPSDYFVLNNSKVKKVVSNWHDQSYKKVIKKLIANINDNCNHWA